MGNTNTLTTARPASEQALLDLLDEAMDVIDDAFRETGTLTGDQEALLSTLVTLTHDTLHPAPTKPFARGIDTIQTVEQVAQITRVFDDALALVSGRTGMVPQKHIIPSLGILTGLRMLRDCATLEHARDVMRTHEWQAAVFEANASTGHYRSLATQPLLGGPLKGCDAVQTSAGWVNVDAEGREWRMGPEGSPVKAKGCKRVRDAKDALARNVQACATACQNILRAMLKVNEA